MKPNLSDPPATAEAHCRDCGAAFLYEPIFIGEVDLARPLETHCPACKSEIEAAEAREGKARAEAERRELVRQTLPPALLPKTLNPENGTDLAHPDFNLPMWKLLKLWRPRKAGNWLGLVGPAGRCKTRCLALLAEKLIMQGNRLVWTSAMRLHTETTINLKSRERALHVGAVGLLAECRTAPWLIIDDLGNNEWSPPFESHMFTILDHRRTHCLPTAFSSNTHPMRFHRLITSVNPEALIGRLLEGTSLFDFTPPDQLEIPSLS